MSKPIINIAGHLPAMARRQPDTPAIHFPAGDGPPETIPYITRTFGELDAESDHIAAGLQQIGIGPGVRTVLMVKPSVEFFELTFGLFKAGAIPVMVDPGMGLKNLGQCLAEAEPDAFVGITKAHFARLLLGWGKKTIKTLVTVGARILWGGHSLEEVKRIGRAVTGFSMVEPSPQTQASILFTSGSTGVPKGAIYSHRNFTAQVESLRDLYDIQPGEIDLPTFPLFALFAPAFGMTSVIPVMDATKPARVDPHNIIGPIQRFSITNMFGSPALINRVGRFGSVAGVKLPSLKRVISAGAPVPAVAMKRFSSMLNPETQIFTPYGATESLPVASIGSHDVLNETAAKTDEGAGVCVGIPQPNISLKIISISDDPIAEWDDDLELGEGEIGEVVVKGDVVTRGYYNRTKSNELAKILHDENGSCSHRMGDLGYLDDRGRLWFCGRKAHRVVMPGMTLFTVPCESIFNTHSEVFRSALVGIEQVGKTIPVMIVELEQDSEGRRDRSIRGRILQELLELAQRHVVTRTIKHVLFHLAFPVDIRHNAKIFREKLAPWAERQLR